MLQHHVECMLGRDCSPKACSMKTLLGCACIYVNMHAAMCWEQLLQCYVFSGVVLHVWHTEQMPPLAKKHAAVCVVQH
jgi:hypothetical protein